MVSAHELNSVKRILMAIQTYRHLTSDYSDSVNNSESNTYLKQHLSIQDWLVWQSLQVAEIAHRQDSPVDKELSPREFRQLLGQYKRTGYEAIERNRQEEPLSLVDRIEQTL